MNSLGYLQAFLDQPPQEGASDPFTPSVESKLERLNELILATVDRGVPPAYLNGTVSIDGKPGQFPMVCYPDSKRIRTVTSAPASLSITEEQSRVMTMELEPGGVSPTSVYVQQATEALGEAFAPIAFRLDVETLRHLLSDCPAYPSGAVIYHSNLSYRPATRRWEPVAISDSFL